MPKALLTKLMAVAAIIIITVPAIDINRAFLAVETFSGLPCALKKRTPVATQKTTTAAIPTFKLIFLTFSAMPSTVTARDIAGKDKRLVKIIIKIDVLFLILTF